ncbi:thiamine pyrophosphate-binding protein [Arthrobacter sp. CAU 1506]|uniref:thiamine pyrophosphate-binding protein n=1 Tax=Arthrobacter sp. CAU 1506 TaxID=2560052 RepID=UPI0010ABB9B0|nr:thiamine pyrophosphate-dependent enzyme [Arthrobacter sp. CAU 1506]TJY69484.1 thiamine pyrophosphate-binding protein [Arthrobacter sp. CAU 1506]
MSEQALSQPALSDRAPLPTQSQAGPGAQSVPAVELPDGVVAENVGLTVLTLLHNYGIDAVFGIPGTHNLEFYRHLSPLGIRAVTSRHEQGAGYGADGWSQQTGLPGVVITTSGPGLLNALSAAGTAYCESRPLIILSPGVPEGEEFADVGALHETKDATGAAGAIVEWSRRVHTGTEAAQAIHDAFELFRYGRPRPVHIEVPLNVLEGPSDCPAELLEPAAPHEPAGASAQAIRHAAQLLAESRRPVILAGGGSLRAGVELLQLAEVLDAPVVTTLNGKGAVPESHPLSLGSDIRLPAAQQLCEEADVLLVIGSKVGEAELWFNQLHPSGTVIRVDILPGQMAKNIVADVPLVGDSAAVVPQLLAALEEHNPPVVDQASASERVETGRVENRARGDRGADRVARLRPVLRDAARELAPPLAALAEQVASVLPANAVLGGDSSQVTYFGTASFVPQERAHSFLYTPAYATLGYGLPASIGAKVAAPDRPVVCVLGDGALMFAVQELATAVEQRLDLVVVCADNGGYGEIRQNELDRGIAPVGVDLVQPDWAALATVFGGHGERITAAEDFAPALAAAIDAGGLRLLHVPTALFE